MNTQEYINKQKKAYAESVDVAEYLVRIYPDLEVIENRWRRKYYCSKEVNHKAVDYHNWHSCGCCDDAILYIAPYILEGKNTYVYSNPPEIAIGEKNPYYGRFYDEPRYTIWNTWLDTLKENNINEVIIEKIRQNYLKEALASWEQSCNQN